ncbi:hypothetical protein [Streptomyces narbonensis]
MARLFREQVGATPAAYVERVRVEAARMLLEGGASVGGGGAERAGQRREPAEGVRPALRGDALRVPGPFPYDDGRGLPVAARGPYYA